MLFKCEYSVPLATCDLQIMRTGTSALLVRSGGPASMQESGSPVMPCAEIKAGAHSKCFSDCAGAQKRRAQMA